jgi:hypothetical protein
MADSKLAQRTQLRTDELRKKLRAEGVIVVVIHDLKRGANSPTTICSAGRNATGRFVAGKLKAEFAEYLQTTRGQVAEVGRSL